MNTLTMKLKKKKELHTKLGGLVKDYLSENIFLEISNVHAPVKEKI